MTYLPKHLTPNAVKAFKLQAVANGDISDLRESAARWSLRKSILSIVGFGAAFWTGVGLAIWWAF